MSDTTHLGLPYLAAAQAQKHVTHNEALTLLDGLVQAAVKSRSLTTPPATPSEGDRYLIAAAPTGAWAGQAGRFAHFMDGAWRFLEPREGWSLWIDDEDAGIVFDGAAWQTMGVPDDLQNLNLLGVNATATATNRLSVASAASLFNHEGAGHQIKLNKNSATDTASILFQTGFSGRAEFGTAGDDDFHIKVSPDGTTFHEAMVVQASSGLVTAKKTLVLQPQPADPASPVNGQLWYNSTTNTFRKRQNGATTDLASGGGGLVDGDYGDVTVSAGGTALNIDADAVSNAKLANMATATLKGRGSAGTGDPEDLTASQVKTLLALQSTDVANFNEAAQDAVGTAFDTTLAYNDAGNSMGRAAITGHISIPAGSNAAVLGSFTLAQLNAAVSDADVANASHTHLLGNVTDVTMTVANLNTLDDGADTTLHFHASDRARANHTGTQLASTISDFNEAAQDAVGAAFDTTLAYNDAGNSIGRAAITGHISVPAGSNAAVLGSFTMAQLDAAVSDGNVSYVGHSHSGLAPAGGAAGQVLKKLSATDYDYSWQADATGGGGLSDADYGDITVSGGATVFTIDNDVVTNAKAANMATATLKGRVTAGTGDPEDLTGTQATTLLDVFTSGLKGLAPASGGGTTNFLRADGTWAAPPGGGGSVSDGDKGDIIVSGSGTVWDLDIAGETVGVVDYPDEILFRDVSGAANRKTSLRDLFSEIRRTQHRWGFYYFNDFIQDPNATIGDAQLTEVNSGTSAGTSWFQGAENNRPGQVNLTTGTTATGRAALMGTIGFMLLGGGETVFETAINLNALSNATDRYQLVIGLFDTNSAVNQVDAVAFVYDEGGVATGSTACANWQAVCSSNSVRTWNGGASGSSAVAAATWMRLKIVVNAAGTQADFFVDDVLRYSITSNIPTSSGRNLGFGLLTIKSIGTAQRTMTTDYLMVDQDFTTAR